MTRIVYPYNEILPRGKAHDVYIFDTCAALGAAGMEVALWCGAGSASDEQLFSHYSVPRGAFSVERLPLLRKNLLFRWSWNLPFFWATQKKIEREKPDWLFLSVRKAGHYHLLRKVSGVRYLYEVHELAFYPNGTVDRVALQRELEMFTHADQITVTTEALHAILRAPPYALELPIEVVPLAVKHDPLPPPTPKSAPLFLYIGQLYEGQGIALLLEALAEVPEARLLVVGGTSTEVAFFREYAQRQRVDGRVEFVGFSPPSALSKIAQRADAFVAPFVPSGRMPYVAHTKLCEYAQWGRPIVAPRVPALVEEFSEGKGIILYDPKEKGALIHALRLVSEEATRTRLQREIASYAGKYTWEKRVSHYQDLLSTKKK